MGARPLQRKINELIKVPLSKKILFENIQQNSLVVVDYDGTQLTFDVQSVFDVAAQPMINNDGFIVLDAIES